MIQATGTTTSYLPIRLETLRCNSVVDFDLYIRNGGSYVLYRAASTRFTDRNRRFLLENNVSRLYIDGGSAAVYHRYLERHLREIIQDPELKQEAKAGIVYETARLLVKDLLTNPQLGENIRRSRDFVETAVGYIVEGPEALYSLIRVMSFDYYLYTHSVNVCTLALALARHVGITGTEDLADVGTGALLHDVGKTRVPEAVLKKPGPLAPHEMDIIRLHPGWGLEMVRETGEVTETVCLPIVQHHERIDGRGYPDGLAGNRIHEFSRMVAIADAFDAMTTERVYRSAAGAFTALETMFGETDAFDRELLVQFTLMLGPSHLQKL